MGAAKNNRILPAGNAKDELSRDGKTVQITVCDVGNPCTFVAASDVGLIGTETAQTITENSAVIAKCQELRGKASQLLGMCDDWKLADEADALPLLVLVSPPPADRTADLTARLLPHNKCHNSMAGTGAICSSACGRVRGSVVAK